MASMTDYLRGWLCDRYALVDVGSEDWKPAIFRSITRERVDPRHFKIATSRNGTIERHILPAIGACRLDELRPDHVQKIMTALKAQGKHRTALLVWEILSAALHDANDSKAMTWSPVEGYRGQRMSLVQRPESRSRRLRCAPSLRCRKQPTTG